MTPRNKSRSKPSTKTGRSLFRVKFTLPTALWELFLKAAAQEGVTPDELLHRAIEERLRSSS